MAAAWLPLVGHVSRYSVHEHALVVPVVAPGLRYILDASVVPCDQINMVAHAHHARVLVLLGPVVRSDHQEVEGVHERVILLVFQHLVLVKAEHFVIALGYQFFKVDTFDCMIILDLELFAGKRAAAATFAFPNLLKLLRQSIFVSKFFEIWLRAESCKHAVDGFVPFKFGIEEVVAVVASLFSLLFESLVQEGRGLVGMVLLSILFVDVPRQLCVDLHQSRLHHDRPNDCRRQTKNVTAARAVEPHAVAFDGPGDLRCCAAHADLVGGRNVDWLLPGFLVLLFVLISAASFVSIFILFLISSPGLGSGAPFAGLLFAICSFL